ncbi:TRAP-type C4-dicarboxylate transport system, substrate-binding protein [Pelagibacterium luteolum]|uniref:TRAP-type C4-dicarboxylate transport system, substrate-binding protein n=2 Tax=Pelagibacterium luteolum TaxID=440168 RepID=A0A1G7TN96_9HYPH|nr:TRAP-type C4-dicarboxylate transport system, substrate-binding protein [Pelagibacterium luteolum]
MLVPRIWGPLMFARRFATVALVCAALLPSANAQEVTLRLHQFLPMTDSVPREGLIPWAEAIEAESEGRIQIEFYPSMMLGGAPADLFSQAQDGAVDLIWTVLGYTPGRFPKSEVFEMPFLVTNAEDTSRAFQRYVEDNAMDEFSGVKLIAVHTHGPGLFHSNRPITALEDLAGMKIRGGSRVISSMLADLGAEAIGMPVPEVPESLSRGVIDGATIPWQVTLALRTSELVTNHTEFSGDHGFYTQTFAFVMNRAAYEGLPDDLKAVIDANSGVEWAGRFGAANDVDDLVGRQEAVDAGNTIVVLDDGETARWRAAAQVTIDNWLTEMDAAGLDGAALYESAQALVAEESAR